MKKNIKIFNNFNDKNIESINSLNDFVFVYFHLKNTKTITLEKLDKIKFKNVYFVIRGGFDNKRLTSKKYLNRVTYSCREMKDILNAILSIEKAIDGKWSKFTKSIYIYEYIRKNIIYDDTIENDREIRSLLILLTNRAVCSGFALLYKEMMDRLDINCYYYQKNNHVWNILLIDNEYYELDLTWDACTFITNKNPFPCYFGNSVGLEKKHGRTKKNDFKKITLLRQEKVYKAMLLFSNVKLKTHQIFRNDMSKFELTQLPVGFNIYVYLYSNENDHKIILSQNNYETILGSKDKRIIDIYNNLYFSNERIEKYSCDNHVFLGKGWIDYLTFYKRRDKKLSDSIKTIISINNQEKLIFTFIQNTYKIKIECNKNNNEWQIKIGEYEGVDSCD